MAVKSKRPYLLRALYQWIVDTAQTPYILVDAGDEGVRVPAHHVRDGKIVLNISPSAVRDLQLEDDMVSFDGRFSGTPYFVEVPVARILAIYTKETGEGMMFEARSAATAPESTAAEASRESGKPAANHLKVIK